MWWVKDDKQETVDSATADDATKTDYDLFGDEKEDIVTRNHDLFF